MKIFAQNQFIYRNQLQTQNQQTRLQHSYIESLKRDSITFTAKPEMTSIKTKLQNLPDDKWLSVKFKKYVLENVSEDGLNLLDLHANYFGELLECKTLREAKQLYPDELANAIDAKVHHSEHPRKCVNVYDNIKQYKYPGVSLKSLTLKMVQRYYSQGFWGRGTWHEIAHSTCIRALKDLNIIMSQEYFEIIREINIANSKIERKKNIAANNWTKVGWTTKKVMGFNRKKNAKAEQNRNLPAIYRQNVILEKLKKTIETELLEGFKESHYSENELKRYSHQSYESMFIEDQKDYYAKLSTLKTVEAVIANFPELEPVVKCISDEVI